MGNENVGRIIVARTVVWATAWCGVSVGEENGSSVSENRRRGPLNSSGGIGRSWAALAWLTCVCVALVASRRSAGAQWSAKNGGVGAVPAATVWSNVERRQHGRSMHMCLSGCGPRKRDHTAE